MLDVFLKYTELDTPILFSEENLSGGLWLEVQKPPIRGIHMKLEVKRRKPYQRPGPRGQLFLIK